MTAKKIITAWVFAGFVFSSQATVHAGEWDKVNNPTRLELDFVLRMDRMPLEATVPSERMPWGDTYWPSNRGGIAYRWYNQAWVSPSAQQMPWLFMFRGPSRDEVMKMSRYQLGQLSPAEKFDLVRGYYNYPLTLHVLNHTYPNDAYWEGICHGWAPASANHPEPAPVDARNPDGVMIPFGSADVKAILSYYYGTVNMRVRQLGKRCKENLARDPKSTDADCLDVNAGAFHVVLANYVGLRGQAFLADTSRDNEVWNYPIYAYKSQSLQTSAPTRFSSPRAHHRILVETEVRYPSDDQRLPPQWEPTVGKEQMFVVDDDNAVLDLNQFKGKYAFETANYKYWLELDAAGDIVGGEWMSFDRPDYLWMKNRMEFSGEFSALRQIYRPIAR